MERVEELMPTPVASRVRHRVVVPVLLGALTLGMVTLLAPGAFPQGGSATPPAAPPPATETEVITTGASGPAASDVFGRREEIFKAFYQTGLDTSKAYAITNLAIKKDNMTLLLKQGTVFLMQPIGGEITGAAFIGDGEASMTPPNRTQRFMLNKYYGAESLKEPFTEAIFRFSDRTDRMLIGAGKPVTADAGASARASQNFSDRNGWLNGTRGLHLEMQYLEVRISGLRDQDFFVADFHSSKHDWLTYTYNPQEIQENELSSSETMGAASRRYQVQWCRWHKMGDYAASGHYVMLPERDGPRVLRVQHTDLVVDLPSTAEVKWEARLKVLPVMDNLRALRFDLASNADFASRWYENLRPVSVLSVTDESGQALEFTHKRDQLLVRMPSPVRAGTPIVIVAKGKAQVVYQLTAESFGLLQTAWYPQYGFINGRSTFRWTVKVPKPFLISGSGKLQRTFEDKENGQNCIETYCEFPTHLPWVIFGRFQKTDSVFTGEESKKNTPMTVHSFPTMTVTITDKETLDFLGAKNPITFNLVAPVKKIQGFIDEGKQVLKLYEKIYGPYPYDELHIAQMAPQLSFGQAPQGFVQLWGVAFMSQSEVAASEMTGRGPIDFVHGFFAHEIAHQWWAHQIGWASDDDEWLSESFAEYASGIFVNEYQGPKRFRQVLDDWKKETRLADQEAPIAAANMLAGPNSGDYRRQLLYNKGAYVLHMLRVQLDDEMYSKVMRGLQETYRNQNISTEMLVREVNRITGSDYTYFFDQWFWDVGIPRFRYSWRSEKQPDGKFLITVHVGQEDKNHIKRVLMPIHIHFKDKTIPQYKPVTQMDQDIKLLSPAEPKDVTLDDDHSLLADIVKAS